MEGAHLEPDRKFGHAYLAETARVLNSLSNDAPDDAAEDLETAYSGAPQGLARRVRRLARKSLNLVADGMEAVAWKLRGR